MNVIPPPKPAPVNTPGITWHVITPDTVEAKLSDQPVYICLGLQDQVTLGQMIVELTSYIEQLNQNIEYYEKQLDLGDKHD